MGADDELRQAERDAAASPDAPAPLFRLCCLLLARADPAAAALLPRLEQFSGFAPGWEQLGEALHQSGQAAAASIAFLRAASGYAARDTSDRRLPFARARCLRRAGRGGDARDAYEHALRIDPDYAEAWFGLGLTRQDMGDRSGAAAAFARASALRPGWHEAALNLGVARQEAGDLEAALDAYAAAWHARPASLARIAQALVSHGTGRLWLDLGELRRVLAGRA